MLGPFSWLVVATMAVALYLALSKRFIAAGALIMANIVAFAFTLVSRPEWCTVGPSVFPAAQVRCELALHSDLLVAGEPIAFLQLFSSMFLHADFYHVFGNLLVLFFFALPFEELVGPRRFVAVYLITGIGAAAAQIVMSLEEPTMMLGASGAVFGIIGAFAATAPNKVIVAPIPVVIMLFRRMKVWHAALVFTGIQLLLQFISIRSSIQDNTAYFAHFGGLMTGLLLGFLWLGKGRAARGPTVAGVERFATTPEAKRALEHMRQSKEEVEVYHVWEERFYKAATCPECHTSITRDGQDLVCGQGHRFKQ